MELPEEFDPIGLVRNDESKTKLIESGGIPESKVAVVDVTDRSAVEQFVANNNYDDNDNDNNKLTAFCICTSAKPVPIPGETNPDTGGPVFSFPNGQPELVDWEGQKNQI